MKSFSKIFFSLILGASLFSLISCGKATKMTFIGHASVKLVAKDGTVLYIDPAYSKGDYSVPADYILVTHGHEDHKPVRKLQLKEGGKKIDNFDALVKGEYKTFDFGPFHVEAVPAGGNNGHDVRYCVGYLVTVDGITVYHAGDTSMIAQMKNLSSRHIDYAMYPIDGIFNMDAVEATEVANLVGAKKNIPIHDYNIKDQPKKEEKFTPEGRMLLEYDQTITLKVQP